MPDESDNFSEPQNQTQNFLASPASVGMRTMSSREIADLTGKRHDHVMVDVRKMLADLDLHAPDFSGTYRTDRGNEYECFNLPKRESLILVSGYDVHLRARIIDRWEELEHRPPVGIDVRNLPQLQTIALQLIEVNREQSEQIATLTPKAEALDRISASAGSLTFTQVTKLLDVKMADLTRWMNANGWIYRQNGSWLAYKPHIKNGNLEYKEANYTDQKTGMAGRKQYCHITPKGLAKLSVIFGSMQGKAA